MTSDATSPSPAGRLLVYGATGYTGRLIAAEAAARGAAVVLAGRSPEKLERVATPLGLPSRVASLDDPARLAAMLEDFSAVLHVAGPFSKTVRPMLDACLATNTHYLDVTGEIDVFEAIARRDADARSAGVVLLPGVGFDVVPSDCLAAHSAARVDEPMRLRLAIGGLGGGVSRGTAKTLVEAFADGLRIRQDGLIVRRPMGSLERHFDFGAGPARAIGMPWGDVSTAFHSTGIPNIEVYFVLSGPIPGLLKASRLITPLLRIDRLVDALQRQIDRVLPEGPSEAERSGARSCLLAEVEGRDGRVARSMLETPNGYALTPVAALEAARRVADGKVTAGFQTPATAFGADFVTELEGCIRSDLA